MKAYLGAQGCVQGSQMIEQALLSTDCHSGQSPSGISGVCEEIMIYKSLTL